MKLLLEINEKDVGAGLPERFNKSYRLRKAGRAILFNNKQQIALQYVTKNTYHKLPGGGVDGVETIKEALNREVQEEVGCDLKTRDILGVIIEYRNKFNILQISYCYLADVDGKIGTPSYEKEEIEQGFKLIWVSLDEAIDLLEKDAPKNYEGRFIQLRDLTFLKRARQEIKA